LGGGTRVANDDHQTKEVLMLTKMKLALALCGSLAAGIGGIAAAQGTTDSGPSPDRRAEVQAKHSAKWAEMLAKYDTNRDGKLDAAERKVMIDDRAAAMFQKIDSNGDGQISLDEFKAFKESHPMRHARWGKHHQGTNLRKTSGPV
jgi:hypothetical protein